MKSTPESLIALTDTTIDDYLSTTTEPVLIDFWAKWCGPCRTLAPTLRSIAETVSSLTVATVDVDENPEAVAKYGISSVPTLVLIRDGHVVKKVIGAKSKAALLAELGAWETT